MAVRDLINTMTISVHNLTTLLLFNPSKTELSCSLLNGLMSLEQEYQVKVLLAYFFYLIYLFPDIGPPQLYTVIIIM